MLVKMTSDLDLLGQFARGKSQDAFTALVNRHVNLVYSAALRQVRSPQLAEEVAQSVFADLARSGTGILPVNEANSLTPWLYSVTRRTAIDVIRKESRRQLREQIAVEMNNMNATANEWTQIEPLLDDAMAALDETDRAAILLRYFENKSLREVGEALGTNDDAAQKRVSRAVERLREFFSKQKITIGAGGLAVLISANAVQAAPIGLAATISAAAVLAGTAVHTSTVIAATKTIAMTTLQKTLITAALTAAIGIGIYKAHQAAQLQNQIQTLQQQQSALTDQVKELRASLDEMNAVQTSKSTVTVEDKNRLMELLKLRSEVTRLQEEKMTKENDPATITGKALADRISQFKRYLLNHRDENEPELDLIPEQEIDGLIVSNTNVDYAVSNATATLSLMSLRSFAEMKFANKVALALQDYAKANNGQFPSDFSQLAGLCDQNLIPILTDTYRIAPASNHPKYADETYARHGNKTPTNSGRLDYHTKKARKAI
jgi:RNA polymerase sigma factor (sigma-70 family)